MNFNDAIILAEAAHDAARDGVLDEYAQRSYDGWSYATEKDREECAQMVYDAVMAASKALGTHDR